MLTPKPDHDAIRADIERGRAERDGQLLQDAYALRGDTGLTERLNEMGHERAALAAKTLGYDYD
jgi:hypothetical protein